MLPNRVAGVFLPQRPHDPAWRFPLNGYSLSVDPNLVHKVDKAGDIHFKSLTKSSG